MRCRKDLKSGNGDSDVELYEYQLGIASFFVENWGCKRENNERMG